MAEINEGFDSPTEVVASQGIDTHTRQMPSQHQGSKIRGATVSYHDLQYKVEIPGKFFRTREKQILFGISGVFRPGMNAIMGPTGCGKTTLLDLLAGRSETKGLSGHLLVDGKRQPKNYKCMTGYVVQDDVVMGTLTVRENLMFSANLRISESTPLKVREQIVDDAIQELGLERCANTKIGNEFIRGVSGGERKRTNIGMELITSPSILFLDEPTTGLDANTANSVMSMLQRLSRKGCTIIFSIHQPRFSIFKLFDRLSLLAAGKTIYHGKAMEALDFFRSAGYECEEFNNPSDFFLDVINGDSIMISEPEEDSFVGEKDQRNGAATYEDLNDEPEPDDPDVRRKDNGPELVAKFNESRWYTRMVEDVQPILSRFLETSHDKHMIINEIDNNPQYATSFTTQLKYVSKRAFINFLRNPSSSVMQFAFSIFIAVFLGLVFLRLDYTIEALQSRYGALFFVAVNQLFSNLSAIELFINERIIFAHESAAGFYRVSVYFLSKVFCDLIPMRAFPLVFFLIITFFMIGFQADAGHFFFFLFCLLLTTIAASGIALFVSASIRTFAVANLLTILIYVISMIFSGLLANLRLMHDWISWIQYLSLARYSLKVLTPNSAFLITPVMTLIVVIDPTGSARQALAIIEFKAETFSSGNDTELGTTFLEQQDIDYKTGWDLWQNILAIGLIALGMETLAYIQLRRMKKLK